MLFLKCNKKIQVYYFKTRCTRHVKIHKTERSLSKSEATGDVVPGCWLERRREQKNTNALAAMRELFGKGKGF